jgi:GNAT superfamily N-acetyltransferase
VIERVLSFLTAAEESVVDDVRPIEGGTALLTPTLPLVWALNAVRVEDPELGAERAERAAERAQTTLGHRKLLVHDAQAGAGLAPRLAERGWNVTRLAVLVKSADPDRPAEPGRAAEPPEAVGAATLAAFRREQPFGWQNEAIRQLAEMDARYTRSLRARSFVAPADRPASACRLYSRDGVAQVDEVGTLEAHRGRGLARATVLAACDAAAAGGHDLTFLLTDAADWPQRLYERLGFEEIGSVYEFLKLPVSSA